MAEEDGIFDTIINRADSPSIKWGGSRQAEVISFGIADMDFQSPSCVRNALINKAKSGLYAYEYKTDGYYQAISGWFNDRHHWTIEKEWLTDGPGSWAMLALCLQAYTMPGYNILIHAPHFHPAVSVIESAGRKIVAQALAFDGVRYIFDPRIFEETLVRQNVRLFFLMNPHNPTGLMFSRAELSVIAEICEKYGVLVVSDEINGYLTYDDAVFVPYASLSSVSRLNSITLTSPSKAFNLQGLTYAIGIIPDKVKRQKLQQVRVGMGVDFATNVFSIAAAEAAYRYGGEWLICLNRYLQGNLDFMDSYLKTNLPQVKLIRPHGGYIAWLDFTALRLTPEALRNIILEKAKVNLTWGESFGHEGEGFERINFACPRGILEKGLARIKNAFS